MIADTSTSLSASLKPYAEYKESGLPWLGMVPEHWVTRRLKQIARLAYGDSLPQTGRTEGTVPVFGSNGRVGWHSISNTLAPCIIVGRKGSFGKVNFSKDATFVIDTAFFIDRRISKADIRWLYYTLSWIGLDGVSKDSAVPGLNREDAYQQVAALPPPAEQAAIVRFLDWATGRLERAIRAKRKVIALLHEQKQAIIHRAVTRGLDPAVPLKDSGIPWLGEIPAHWEVRRLKSLVREAIAGPYGSSLTKSMYTQVGYRVYGQQQVIPDDFTVGDYYISKEQFARMQRYQVFAGDLLVSVMGTVGRVAVVPDDAELGIINPRLVRYRPDMAAVRPRWLQIAMQNGVAQAQLAEASKGTTMDGLNMRILGKLLLLKPPLAEQDAILDYVARERQPFTNAISRLEREIDLLREYRTRLVADVVTGKLDVRAAAASLPVEVGSEEVVDDGDGWAGSDEEANDDEMLSDEGAQHV